MRIVGKQSIQDVNLKLQNGEVKECDNCSSLGIVQEVDTCPICDGLGFIEVEK